MPGIHKEIRKNSEARALKMGPRALEHYKRILEHCTVDTHTCGSGTLDTEEIWRSPFGMFSKSGYDRRHGAPPAVI